jgi:hypothetical protein
MSTVPIFRCASCGEYIAADAPTCRFCNSPVDFNRAMQSAVFERNKNALLNRASYLQILGTAMIPLSGLGLIIGLLRLGIMAVGFVVPLVALFTFVELGKLGPSDPDVAKGRKQCLVSVACSVLAWLFTVGVTVLLVVASAS